MLSVFLSIVASLISYVGFVSAKGFWSSSPAVYSDLIRQGYPVGNGRMGAIPFGAPGSEKVNLNIDSLWSGGPFENTTYRGGNPTTSKAEYLSGIRQWIFQNGTGNLTELYDDALNYGSYAVAGNLSVSINGIGTYDAYNRSLDFNTGAQSTVFKSNSSTITTTVYCSYPDAVCIYDVSSTGTLPEVSISLENQLQSQSLVRTSCSRAEQYVRLQSQTQVRRLMSESTRKLIYAKADIGMSVDLIARLITSSVTSSGSCSNSTGSSSVSLVIPGSTNATSFTLVIGGGTDYDASAGNAAHNFSFRGEEPSAYVEDTTSTAALKPASELYAGHLADYQPLANAFLLDLPDTAGSEGLETAQILAKYNVNSEAGDPYLESIMQACARHLFM